MNGTPQSPSDELDPYTGCFRAVRASRPLVAPPPPPAAETPYAACSRLIRDVMPPRPTATPPCIWRRPRFTRAQRQAERPQVAALRCLLRGTAGDPARQRKALCAMLSFLAWEARRRGVPLNALYTAEVCRRFLDLLAVAGRRERRRLNAGHPGMLGLYEAAAGIAASLAGGAGQGGDAGR